FSSRRRHTRFSRDWSSDVCSSDLLEVPEQSAPAHPMQADTGLVAINMYTRDIEVSHRELSGAGQQFRTPPATWAVPLNDKMVSRSEERRVGKACRSRLWTRQPKQW